MNRFLTSALISMAIGFFGCADGPNDETYSVGSTSSGAFRDPAQPSEAAPPREAPRTERELCTPPETTFLRLDANLDASAEQPNFAFDPNNPVVSSNFATFMSMFDGAGEPVAVALYFVKTAAGWDYHLVDVHGESFASSLDIGAGSLVFGADGTLSEVIVLAESRLPDHDGFSIQEPIRLEFGGISAISGGQDSGHVTSLPGFSTVTAQSVDGHPMVEYCQTNTPDLVRAIHPSSQP